MNFDLQYLHWLQDFRDATGGSLDTFFEIVSLIVIKPWVYVVMAGIYWCVSRKLGVFLLFNMIGSHALTMTLKNTCCVLRPWMRDPTIIPAGDAKITAPGYSFPSGHSTMAAAQFGSIGVWFRKHRWVVVLTTAFVLLVMFSRNYLGVHTPQDVVVGALLTCLVMFVNWKLMHWVECAEQSTKRALVVLVVGLGLAAAFLAFNVLKPYPLDVDDTGALLNDPVKGAMPCFATAGMLVGLLTGWFAERRWVRFAVDGTPVQRILRLVVGAGMMLGIYLGLKDLSITLLGNCWGRFFWQFLLVFAAVFLYPMVFSRIHARWTQPREG